MSEINSYRHVPEKPTQPLLSKSKDKPSLKSKVLNIVLNVISLGTRFLIHKVRDTLRDNIFGSPEELQKDRTKWNKLQERYKGEEVSFSTPCGDNLEGLFISPQKPRTPHKVVMLCSGSHTPCEVQMEPHIKAYVDKGFHVLMFNYVGVGDSEGTPSEQGLYDSGEAALQFLREKKEFKHGNIVVHGYSLGSTPASYLANKYHDLSRIIIDRGFSKMSLVASDFAQYDYNNKIITFFARKLTEVFFPIDNISKIADSATNILVASGMRDEIMLHHHTESFAKKKLRCISVNSSHDDACYVNPSNLNTRRYTWYDSETDSEDSRQFDDFLKES